MPENIVARDLMLHDVAGIRRDQTLGEAMQALVDLQADKEIPNALVVLDADGNYEGILTARLLCKSLLDTWTPREATARDDAGLEQDLLSLVRQRSDLPVHDALSPDLPTAEIGDRLLRLIQLSTDQRLEFIPVVDKGHVHGLVPVTRIFLATASLALAPEDEGVRFDQGQA